MSRGRAGSRRRIALAGFVVSAVLPAIARAGADVEVFAGGLLSSPQMRARYDASYTPSRVGGITELFATPDPRSHATQLVSLDGGRGTGIGFGIAVYPDRVFGMRLFVDRVVSDLSGANAPHAVDLTWDSINFPASDPVVRRTGFSFDVPDTAARLKLWTLSLDGIARWRTGASVSGSVSGGLSYFRVQARGMVVGALAGWLGGHAVLFTQLHEVELTTEVADTFGVNLGADVSVAIGSKLDFFADGRYFHASKVDAGVHFERFASQPTIEVPLASIERGLALGPVKLDPRLLRLLVGVKWRP